MLLTSKRQARKVGEWIIGMRCRMYIFTISKWTKENIVENYFRRLFWSCEDEMSRFVKVSLNELNKRIENLIIMIVRLRQFSHENLWLNKRAEGEESNIQRCLNFLHLQLIIKYICNNGTHYSVIVNECSLFSPTIFPIWESLAIHFDSMCGENSPVDF